MDGQDDCEVSPCPSILLVPPTFSRADRRQKPAGWRHFSIRRKRFLFVSSIENFRKLMIPAEGIFAEDGMAHGSHRSCLNTFRLL
jgi:hypothetical protein